jgi:hypothetical protein
MGFVRSKTELRIIPICDQFYKMALDIVKLLLETCNGNKYILVVIDHYSKWCEAKIVVNHDVETITRFLENEIIYRFNMPKYVLIGNGYEWVAEFD